LRQCSELGALGGQGLALDCRLREGVRAVRRLNQFARGLADMASFQARQYGVGGDEFVRGRILLAEGHYRAARQIMEGTLAGSTPGDHRRVAPTMLAALAAQWGGEPEIAIGALEEEARAQESPAARRALWLHLAACRVVTGDTRAAREALREASAVGVVHRAQIVRPGAWFSGISAVDEYLSALCAADEGDLAGAREHLEGMGAELHAFGESCLNWLAVAHGAGEAASAEWRAPTQLDGAPNLTGLTRAATEWVSAGPKGNLPTPPRRLIKLHGKVRRDLVLWRLGETDLLLTHLQDLTTCIGPARSSAHAVHWKYKVEGVLLGGLTVAAGGLMSIGMVLWAGGRHLRDKWRAGPPGRG